MLGRVGAESADCYDQVLALFEECLPVSTRAHDEFRHRKNSIMPEPPWHRSGMHGLTDASDTRMPIVAAYAGHHANCHITCHHYWALFDM